MIITTPFPYEYKEVPSQLIGRKIAVFDAEIKERIENLPNGWKDHHLMGVSVLVIFDYRTMRYRIFGDANIEEAISILNTYDIVVGFNTVGFDWKLLRATYPMLYQTTYAKRVSKDFDILREIWISLGLDPDNFNGKTHGGYKLDHVAEETVQLRKTGDGANAPKLYQQGLLFELIDYCVQDVKIEKELFEFAVRNKFVRRNGKPIPLNLSVVDTLTSSSMPE